MNNAPRPPQFPDPNRQPMPPAGFEPPVGDTGSAHILEQHGTEMMRPPAPQPPHRPIEQQGPPTERIYPYTRESLDPVSPIQRTALALASLKLGESAVVWMPGKGNTRMTLAGRDPRGNPAYREAPIEGVAPAAAPATGQREAPLPPPVFGPQGGANFGPRGTRYEVPERPTAVTRGGQAPEARDPDAGPDFVDLNRDLTDEESVYDNPLQSSREGRFKPKDAGPAAATVEQPIVEVDKPPVENLTPETVQTDPDETTEVDKDLVDQLAEGTAPPIAEMADENRPDMTAVKRPGAAAAKRAEETRIPDDEAAPNIQGIGGNVLPDDNQEADITQILPEGVVPEGERPPDTDFMPGSGPRGSYRR